MGVPLAESKERYQETLEILRLALSQENFSYHGKHFTYDNITTYPRPFTAGGPPILQGTVSPDSFRERGWHVTSVSRLLVLPDDRTARRRVAQHASIFETALPTRTAAVRCWLKEPIGRLAGVLFLTDVRQASTRHRVGIRQASSVRARRGET